MVEAGEQRGEDSGRVTTMGHKRHSRLRNARTERKEKARRLPWGLEDHGEKSQSGWGIPGLSFELNVGSDFFFLGMGS